MPVVKGYSYKRRGKTIRVKGYVRRKPRGRGRGILWDDSSGLPASARMGMGGYR